MSEPEFIGHSTGPVAGDYFASADSGHRMIFAPTRTGMSAPVFGMALQQGVVTGLAPGQLAAVTNTEKPE